MVTRSSRASPLHDDSPDEIADHAVDAALAASRALLGVVALSLQPVLNRVTLPQFRVLVLLDQLGPSRSGDLAERLGVHPSTFSRTTDRMVSAGLVRRRMNPYSGRETLVDATPKGRRLVVSVMRRRRQVVEQALNRLTAKQRREVLEGFTTFAAALNEPGYESAATQLGA